MNINKKKNIKSDKEIIISSFKTFFKGINKEKKMVKEKKGWTFFDFLYILKIIIGLGITLYFTYIIYYNEHSGYNRYIDPNNFAKKDWEQTKILNDIYNNQRKINNNLNDKKNSIK